MGGFGEYPFTVKVNGFSAAGDSLKQLSLFKTPEPYTIFSRTIPREDQALH